MAVQTTSEWNLLRRRERLLRDLRELTRGNIMRGSLSTVARRCGKKRCVCVTEGRKHEGRYLSVSMEGRTRLVYVRDEQEEEVVSALDAHRRLRRLVDQLTEVNLDLLRLQQKQRRRAKRR